MPSSPSARFPALAALGRALRVGSGLGVALALVLVLFAGHAPLFAQETRSARSATPRHRALSLSLSRSSDKLPMSPLLPSELDAGVIPRPALQAVLASGIGRFLQQVRAEPSVARGRFVGWRVLTLFPGRADVSVQVLRPGDTVTRVNGKTIERPEQFKTLWDSLASASELVLDIERDGRPSRLRYVIAP
jgi:hypothetical protein